MTAVSTDALPVDATPRNNRRILMIAGPLVLLLAGGAYWLSGGRYVATENAYLHQARISVAAQVGGRVASVDVIDNQTVKAGDRLFAVDDTPYRLALAQADTAVAAARLGVEQ